MIAPIARHRIKMTPTNNLRKYVHLLFLILLVLSSSCSVAEDKTYLTPITEATYRAANWDEPVKTKLQAVVVARAMLDTTRLRYTEEPRVISVDELRLDDAEKRIAVPGVFASEDRPGDTKVWFVLFEGDWQIIPPDPYHNITPEPPFHGCVFVMFEANKSAGEGRDTIGTIECTP